VAVIRLLVAARAELHPAKVAMAVQTMPGEAFVSEPNLRQVSNKSRIYIFFVSYNRASMIRHTTAGQGTPSETEEGKMNLLVLCTAVSLFFSSSYFEAHHSAGVCKAQGLVGTANHEGHNDTVLVLEAFSASVQ